MSNFDNTPIIVGVGQQTWREPDTSRTPVDALSEASALALADVGRDTLVGAIDAVAMVRFIADTDPGMAALFPRNPGRQVAERLGIKSAAVYQGVIGGNTPQYLINHFAGKLASGDHAVLLLCGAELLATMFSALRTGADISAWPGAAEAEPTTVGIERDGLNQTEKLHGLYEPVNTYPLFENSLRHQLGIPRDQHQETIAQICSEMSQVAAGNPHAWRQTFQSAEEVARVDAKNRYIGYPYTKAMNPVLAVDMAASVVITTVGKARELGIDPGRWIYLRGGVDVNDIWHVSERLTLHQSPAIRLAWDSLRQSTGIGIDAVTDFDIYSCFPSAVQIACNEIGLSPLDPRGVTVTGGLPYLGGPGNNYSLHAIAEMVSRLRSRGTGHGLVTANGLYLTKHSLGLYSTEPAEHAWQALDSTALQKQIDSSPRLSLAEDPTGPAIVESYTVAFGRDGPERGIVIARNGRGERIIANTAGDTDTLEQLITLDPIGRSGQVKLQNGLNIFEI
jgi:acetyl-CoA C-acetyltransferase